MAAKFLTTISNAFFFDEKIEISINISLKFVPRGLINNIPALVQIIAWCRPGDKPLSEPMMISLLTHICVARPQWVHTMKERVHGSHFADDIFKCSLSYKICGIFIQISLKYVRSGPISQKLACDGESLSEPMIV